MGFGDQPYGANPYQDPSWLRPVSSGGPPPPGGGGTGGGRGGGHGTVRALALGLAGTALTFTAIAALLVLTDPGRAADGAVVATGKPVEADGARSRHPDDPRAPMTDSSVSVVSEDWLVVTSSQRYTAFDVPPDWGVGPEGSTLSFSREGDWENPVTIGDPAMLWNPACEYWSEDTMAEAEADGADALVDARALAGTRSGQGTTGTEESSRELAMDLLVSRYGRGEGAQVEVTETRPFGNDHGVRGHVTTATITGRPENPEARCPVRDGLAIGVSYLNPVHDLVEWGLVADTGYDDELSDETIEQILGSIRYHDAG
ncbi:hypothetical protein [Streptomyces ginkgonis]|uniref:hypothetical protein n=1 Tax=Streptomyces ginkgonis TaxID=1812259 RepID=UPI002176A622|nr:hypothetical protein [Streptomyces ginkgonis]